jgi:twitching motility protein PilT
MSFNVAFEQLLQEVLDRNASDLHISSGAPIMLRIDGVLVPSKKVPDVILSHDDAKNLCFANCDEKMVKSLNEVRELDFSFGFKDKSRFRANLFFQTGNVTGAFRPIPQDIPTMEDLKLPDSLKKLTKLPRGMILVTGPTGSGKSTTLASMIGHINQTRGDHIITIEDPIEFMHKSSRSLVAQREVGKDTHSFVNALKFALRQDPDVVLIGEMRDIETISAAITISETGHLVFATLHTNNAVQTINRIIDVFPAHQQIQIRTQLSFILEGVISQQLIPKIGGGRQLVQEIMIPNHAIRNLIREEKIHQIYTSIQIGQENTGMITMNQSLANAVKQGLITSKDAIENATDTDEIKKMLDIH